MLKNATSESAEFYTDPIFGISIKNPLLSSATVTERMRDKKAVEIDKVAFHIKNGDLSKDWVIAGIIISKGLTRTAKNGSKYLIWQISDLKLNTKTLSIFLFKNAYNDLWKVGTGTVVAILNPNVFEKKQQNNNNANNKVSLSIDNAQSVMIMGQSKDLGYCRGKKRNGETCGAEINIKDFEFCLYHLPKEFKKFSQRSEFRPMKTEPKLSVLKNDYFRNQMSHCSKTVINQNTKQRELDQQRLMSLGVSDTSKLSGPVPELSNGETKRKIAAIDVNNKQYESIPKKLKVDEKVEQSRKEYSVLTGGIFTNKTSAILQNVPILSKQSFSIDLNMSSSKKAELAKLKALEIIKKKPIEQSNPNFIKYRGTSEGKKRILDELNSSDVNNSKNELFDGKVLDKQRIEKIMAATSSHTDLINLKECEEEIKYFNNMEKKEEYMEKMLNIYKLPCKAVICLKCKYKSFSLASHCKSDKHPFKVVDAEKRFFECKDCLHRTITFNKIPEISCKNCHSSRWKRVPMIREDKCNSASESLSIRGDEEKFL